MISSEKKPVVAIACGGTGGHLFPGLAVADKLRARGCAVTILISPKEVDQAAVRDVQGLQVVTLPAVGWQRGSRLAFFRGFLQSFRQSSSLFRSARPDAALAMGGFTSAAPVLAAKRSGARSFLHESNAIAGRANRLLARFVDEAFVGFPMTGCSLKARKITLTGTPVRPGFEPGNAAACRRSFGLDPQRPVILVMGGSQGAGAINELVIKALPLFAKSLPECQWIHLTGPRDFENAKRAYERLQLPAFVSAFYDKMNLALGAATLAISRSGASSLAEFAAMQVPSVLIPFPAATDNHQFHNATQLVQAGAARLLPQSEATVDALSGTVAALIKDAPSLEKMRSALAVCLHPHAAERIAQGILEAVGHGNRQTFAQPEKTDSAQTEDQCDFSLAGVGGSR